jgi:hypothetical protein
MYKHETHPPTPEGTEKENHHIVIIIIVVVTENLSDRIISQPELVPPFGLHHPTLQIVQREHPVAGVAATAIREQEPLAVSVHHRHRDGNVGDGREAGGRERAAG